MQVFVSNIFLRLLESENSSYEHKMLVLEVFHNLCQVYICISIHYFSRYSHNPTSLPSPSRPPSLEPSRPP